MHNHPRVAINKDETNARLKFKLERALDLRERVIS
jgi:hypothetical protein